MLKINDLLRKAVDDDCSDIHLKVGCVPCFRVHSELVNSDFPAVDIHAMQNIIDDIMPNHITEEFNLNHEADFSIEEEGIGRFRVNVFYTKGMPAIVMRHVKSKIPTFEELNMPVNLREITDMHRGIIIVSGTTGSGKSSTLAAIIGEMNRKYHSRIITLEDPVEYSFEDDKSLISQREVGLDTPSYASALRHVLRQDPDVIMIGEMRDQLSIRTALLAAETGHLVLSTLHASGSAIAISRILDVFQSDDQEQIRMAFAATPHVIICQRLIPRIGGGVHPAVEIMVRTPTVRKMLERNEIDLLGAAIETGEEDGMITFNKSIYKMIKDGIITEKDGMRYATNPESLLMNLKGIFLDEGKRILGGI